MNEPGVNEEAPFLVIIILPPKIRMEATTITPHTSENAGASSFFEKLFKIDRV
jgi:hypothetical protein